MKKKLKITLEKVAGKVDKLTAIVDKLATLMVDGFENLNQKVDGLSRDMTDVRRDILDIKVENKGHSKAIDKDSVTLINHEARIKKLEHVR